MNDFDAIDFGAAYALYMHGQDVQSERLIGALREREYDPDATRVIQVSEPERVVPAINHNQFIEDPGDWDSYIGQEPLKNQLMISIGSAKIRGKRLPHVLLASGYPGVGKTKMARLIAKALGVRIIEVVPPFKVESLVAAAEELGDHDILFIDEIHKLTDGVGARGAEMLLKVLEEGVAYLPNGDVVRLADITIIGATTDQDKLPEPVVDRFKIKPYFQAYDEIELGRIAIQFAYKEYAEEWVTDEMADAIAMACRGTPRIASAMVEAVRDLATVYKRQPTPQEMLSYLEVEPDGLTRTHIHYLTAMRQYFGREARDGGTEYIVGEAAIQQILRETKQGIGRVERFLVERGLIDRTPRGRRLTPLGIARAEQFIADGKGAADVA